MIDAIPAGWLDIGAKGLLGVVTLMIFTGTLVPRRTVNKLLQLLQERIVELTGQLAKVEKERDDAVALAKTQAETINIQARTKDASLAAVEAIRAEVQDGDG